MIHHKWDLEIEHFCKLAEKKKNKRMIEMCNKILILPTNLKKYIIHKYIGQVQKLSWIAFYRNRRVEHEDVCDYGEIGV